MRCSTLVERTTQLDVVADELNGCPRKTLGYATPLEIYAQHLARLEQQPDSLH